MSKNEEKAAKEIYTVYLAIKNDYHFPNRYDLDNIEKMGAYLSDKDFVWHLKATYPTPWHKIFDAICELIGINKTFSNYDKLKKAFDRLKSDPNYALKKNEDNVLAEENPYNLDESQYGE